MSKLPNSRFRIVARPSHGGFITDFFFLVDGEVRHSCYGEGRKDDREIRNFAKGYTGGQDVPIEDVPASWTSRKAA